MTIFSTRCRRGIAEVQNSSLYNTVTTVARCRRGGTKKSLRVAKIWLNLAQAQVLWSGQPGVEAQVAEDSRNQKLREWR